MYVMLFSYGDLIIEIFGKIKKAFFSSLSILKLYKQTIQISANFLKNICYYKLNTVFLVSF